MKQYKQIEDQRGVTLVEVLICMVIVSMIIGPLTLNFTTANKTKAEAKNIIAATNHAEKLMIAIQEQLTEDEFIKEKKDGNVEKMSSDEEKRYNDCISKYIPKSDTGIDTPVDMSLTDYLEGIDLNEYANDEFAYQVVMWPLSKAAVSSGGGTTEEQYELIANKESMEQKGILRLASDSTEYTFDDRFFSLLTDPITFKANISSELASAFSGKEGSDVVKNTFKMPAGAKNDTYVKVDLSNPILDGSKKYIVHKTSGKEETYGIVIPVDDPSISTLCLDITPLLGGVKLKANYTFKIVNDTGNDLAVKVMSSYEKKENEAEQLKEIKEKNDKFHWTAVNSDNKKTNFEFVDNFVPEENFVIAIFVREKNAPIGKSGKIIKKMVDIFSYDVTYNERR